MTALADKLVRQIRATGPMTVADYMTTCLLHPTLGYYTTRDPLGVRGDFTTAPEISQMFGELIGLALAQAWLDRGAPAPFVLGELGPGRGTLMADALRATARVPGFHAAARVQLIEASPALRARQAETLAPHAPESVDRIEDLAPLPLFLIANEFFDALPVRQFLRDGPAWRERLVGTDGQGLSFALSDALPIAALAPRLDDTTEGDMVETSGAAQAIAQSIGAHIGEYGGTALMFDYGNETSLGDTFQAVRDHKKESPLAAPGQADLTAHVDFGALARAAAPHAQASALTPQGVLLERWGITARAQTLARHLAGAALEAHVAAHRRLTHPDEMGHLFKAMALHDPHGPPPGLEPAP